MDVPTTEEIRRVRQWECSQTGHVWRADDVIGREFPELFLCTRCGVTLRVVAER